MPTLTRSKKTIIIELDEEVDAQHVQMALMHHQWIRMSKGSVVIAQPEPDPKMSDHDRIISGGTAPFFPMPDGKRAKPILLKAADPDREQQDPSCIVQHIGAGLRDRPYEYSYNKMISVGFNILRSPKGPENKHWELWYLPGMWSLTGALKDVKDRRKLVDWLFDNVVPGNVSFHGESWALSFE